MFGPNMCKKCQLEEDEYYPPVITMARFCTDPSVTLFGTNGDDEISSTRG
jgi:hypothetical protein